MINLTLDAVKQAARDAYDAKKLNAQHPEPSERRCTYYLDENYRCAIGWAVTEAEAKAMCNHGTIDDLVDFHKVEVAPSEGWAIRLIQCLHDTWAVGNFVSRPDDEKRFLLAIDHYPL